jgi:2-oxoglutarate ferredoxin oxidoreductase subunit delta
MVFWREPLDAQEIKVKRGTVHIIEERCKGCGYCIAYCPRQVLERSKDFTSRGYHPPILKAEECLNCNYCELLCPEFAIFAVEKED